MCDNCGCNITPGNRHLLLEGAKFEKLETGEKSVTVLQNLLHANDHQAQHNRQHFDKYGVLAINLMSSPGSGKTALLEKTIATLKTQYRIAVIEGDLETENDADRIRAQGVPAVQIATGTACHLDAHMVHDALHEITLADLDIVFIENVGNLVCPASFDLGHHLNVTVLSTTEGDDKPAKYPVMFKAADLMLVSKSDLLPVLGDFSVEKATGCLRQLANAAPVLTLSSRSDEGMSGWYQWLAQQLDALRTAVSQGQTLHPAVQPDGQHLHLDA